MIVRDVSNEFDIDRVKDIPWKKDVKDKNALCPRSVLHFFFGIKTSLRCPLRIVLPKFVVPVHIPKCLSALRWRH